MNPGQEGLPGWEDLSHSGLLLDAARLAELARQVPEPLGEYTERHLRHRAATLLDGIVPQGADASGFVAFVLEQVCGFDAVTGAWNRGGNIASSHARRAITGEAVKPRHLWTGPRGARLPVFLDDSPRLGVGRSRRTVSQALGWLRAGDGQLALVTNARQWRLLFAGIDYDASCQWDLESWFAQGELVPQVTAMRTLLQAKLWTPPTEDAAPPLLQAIRDTRKGQAELSEVLGERCARGRGDPHPRPRRGAQRKVRGCRSRRHLPCRLPGGDAAGGDSVRRIPATAAAQQRSL